MLKQRIITAVIIVVVFVGALALLPASLFAAFAALITLVGAWEWADLAGFKSALQRGLYVLLCAVVIGAALLYLDFDSLRGPAAAEPDSPLAFRNLLMIGCVWWALALLWVQSYPQSAILWQGRWIRALIGLLVLVPAWVALSYLRVQDSGQWLVVLLIAVVASADIGGFFVGRRWGRHKLAANVSPGKTWEGFAGGVAANVLLAALVASLWQGGLLFWLALIIPTSLVSVLGDLLESMFKRHRGVKDSSALLPGHGGVLDRIDSLTAAAPVFALALLIAGWSLN